jgi:hypothetical protein
MLRGQAAEISFEGRTMSLRAWAKEIGITHPTLLYRLQRLPLRLALTLPKIGCKKARHGYALPKTEAARPKPSRVA